MREELKLVYFAVRKPVIFMLRSSQSFVLASEAVYMCSHTFHDLTHCCIAINMIDTKP